VKILGFELNRKQQTFEEVLRRLTTAYEKDSAGVLVTPDTAMESPTVHAIVSTISNRIAALPVHVLQKVESDGRVRKEEVPNHPVNRLLQYPNRWQTDFDFWQDAASCLIRWGNFYAVKLRGVTGPIRALEPIHPSRVDVQQDVATGNVTYRVTEEGGAQQVYRVDQMLHVRGPSRNFLVGDSPVRDCRRSIGLEIAAEKFGASFYANGAVPLMIFKFMQGVGGFKSKEEQKEFIESFERAFGSEKRHSAMLLPKGIEADAPVRIENDKAQFIESRKYQRQVIAAAFGVPPHVVGAMENATYNNVEQMSLDLIINLILPHVRRFEAALEDALLTTDDINSGHIIRFNLDAALRGDFKSRQEGLKIMREWGVINANDWRGMENMNPISDDDGGEDFIRPMNMAVPGEETVNGTETDTASDQAAERQRV
jgi:HK97 family phage portal protein